MKKYDKICQFVGEDEPIRGSIEAIKDILAFLDAKYHIIFAFHSRESFEVVRAYTSSVLSIISNLQTYLEECGEILRF